MLITAAAFIVFIVELIEWLLFSHPVAIEDRLSRPASPVILAFVLVSLLVFLNLPFALAAAIIWIDDTETAFLVVALAIVGAMAAAIFLYWLYTTQHPRPARPGSPH